MWMDSSGNLKRKVTIGATTNTNTIDAF